MIPGDPETRTRRQRERDGIYVEDATVEAIRKTGRELGVGADELLTRLDAPTTG